MSNEQRYPLSWPASWPRSRRPSRSAFDRTRSLEQARLLLESQLALMGARSVVLSTNLELRLDGKPYSNQRQPADIGAALYFVRNGKPYAIACDRWDRVECNVWAIAKHIEALRGQERWGVGTVEQAFSGYAALPPASNGARSHWAVLGLAPGAPREEINDRFRALASIRHPDMGGSNEAMAELNAARDAALKGGAT